MVESSSLDDWAAHIDDLIVATADATMRGLGLVQPPTVHMLVDGVWPPYLGYLTCRPFRRGTDAAAAITGLGVLPSALGVSRLLVTWEHTDLCVALQIPDVDVGSAAVVVVDADLAGHVVRWHPMRVRSGPPGELGLATIIPEWIDTWSVPGGELPGPVGELLELWRCARVWTVADTEYAVRGLEHAGYEVHWVCPPAADDAARFGQA